MTATLDIEPLGDFLRFVESASPGQRRMVVPALHTLAEAARPGATLVAALRVDQRRQIPLFAADLRREFKILGHLVSVAADSQGGLLLESVASVRRRIKEILSASHLKTWAKERLQPILEQHYQQVAQATWKTISKQGVPTTMRDEVEREIIAKGGKRLGLLDIEDDTRTALFNVIRDAREQALSPRVIARMIEQYVPQGRYVNAGSTYRSRLIARTETLHAQRMSSISSYRASPSVEKVIAFDGDGDAECAGRNGEIFTFEDAEAEADETHPNCVLCFAPVS